MNKYILICSCYGMSKKASEAFSLLHPQDVLPEIIKGKDRIHKLAKKLGNEHIIALSKLSGKFAYYIKLDENNKIIEEWDLIRGKRLA